jgi:hypothetical protein
MWENDTRATSRNLGPTSHRRRMSLTSITDRSAGRRLRIRRSRGSLTTNFTVGLCGCSPAVLAARQCARYGDRARACGPDRDGDACRLTDVLLAAVIAGVRPSRRTRQGPGVAGTSSSTCAGWALSPKVFRSHEVSADYAGPCGEDSVVSSEVGDEVLTPASGEPSRAGPVSRPCE